VGAFVLPVLYKLNQRKWFVRRPIKLAVFAAIVFLTLFPYPRVFWRHVQHLRQNQTLTDPQAPGLQPVRAELQDFALEKHLDLTSPPSLIRAVEAFVYHRVPYAWDWDNWGVADYLPSVAEVVAKGREDCDGRAVLAAALIRSFGVPAKLAADPRHVWVSTPAGDVMHPLGKPVFQQGPHGVQIHWRALLDPTPLAYGIAVFPLVRELIILLAAWGLLLSPRMSRLTAGVLLLLLVESLMMIRLAGSDPISPRYGLLVLALAQGPLIAWILLRSRPRPLPAPAALSS
jgi:hypothetical protein